MYTYMIQPCRELSPYVERYWGWKSLGNITLPVLLPGTGMEMIFHVGSPFGIGSRGEVFLQASSAHLLCVRSRPYCLQMDGPLDFLAIRFRAGAFRHFCKIPLKELCDTTYRIETVWGKSGRELAQRIQEAPSCRSRIEWIETYLLQSLSKWGHHKSHVDIAVRQLYYQHESIQIQSLSQRMRMSRRHFERTFQAAIGITPKIFQRLSRFQQTVRELLLTKTTDYLPVALAHGYYDQSHFIREFQKFVQETPSSFLSLRNFLSHFYNTKSPS